jgi:Holliday junction resolvase RusA-like endonuclease
MEIEAKINVRPLSVNQCFRSGRGKTYRTKEYLAYEEEVLYSLPKKKMLKGELGIDFEFGINKRYGNSDLDNFLKPLIDLLGKKLYFKNDAQICELLARKVKSKKDYIEFRLYEIE